MAAGLGPSTRGLVAYNRAGVSPRVVRRPNSEVASVVTFIGVRPSSGALQLTNSCPLFGSYSQTRIGLRLVILNAFVCAYRGWTSLRPEDLGRLWEHFVLNELFAHLQRGTLRYWRDKQGHEVDFIWVPRGRRPLALECKWSGRDLDPGHLLAFGRAYPKFDLAVVATDAEPAFTRKYDGITVRFLTLRRLVAEL